MTSTTSMNISLDKDTKEWVQKIVKKEGYVSCSEYIRSLIRRDMKQQ